MAQVVLFSQTYIYHCECCHDVVEEIGVMGDCSKWADPGDGDDFCYDSIRSDELSKSKAQVVGDY